jgi:hypothetical protein
MINLAVLCSYEKQLKELKDKGYFIMDDGTKSSEHKDPAKKKKTASEAKPGKKRASSAGKAAKASKAGAKEKKAPTSAKKVGRPAKSKKSEDDLDIEESGDASIEDSA